MSDIPNYFYRVSIKALILDNQKRFLLCKETSGFWELPGGRLNYGEKPRTCLNREIKEEMGLVITSLASSPCYFVAAPHHKDQYHVANVLYEIRVNNLDFKPSAECAELTFFTKDEASEQKMFGSLAEFVRMYNPNQHEPGVRYK